MSTCLSMRGVCKSYRAGVRGCSASVAVLRGVDLEVAPGEVVGIAAAPAAGTTTLLMCAAGLLRPDAGAVSWFGRHAASAHGARPEGIAYVSDRPFPYGFLTVREALEYAAIVRDLPLRDSAARVRHAIERTRLAAVSDRRVDGVDADALARLSVAAGLLAEPRLLLVDGLAPGCSGDTLLELAAVLCAAARDGTSVVVAGRTVAALTGAAATVHRRDVRVYQLVAGVLREASAPAGVARRQVVTGRARARVAESSRDVGAGTE